MATQETFNIKVHSFLVNMQEYTNNDSTPDTLHGLAERYRYWANELRELVNDNLTLIGNDASPVIEFSPIHGTPPASDSIVIQPGSIITITVQ